MILLYITYKICLILALDDPHGSWTYARGTRSKPSRSRPWIFGFVHDSLADRVTSTLISDLIIIVKFLSIICLFVFHCLIEGGFPRAVFVGAHAQRRVREAAARGHRLLGHVAVPRAVPSRGSRPPQRSVQLQSLATRPPHRQRTSEARSSSGTATLQLHYFSSPEFYFEIDPILLCLSSRVSRTFRTASWSLTRRHRASSASVTARSAHFAPRNSLLHFLLSLFVICVLATQILVTSYTRVQYAVLNCALPVHVQVTAYCTSVHTTG